MCRFLSKMQQNQVERFIPQPLLWYSRGKTSTPEKCVSSLPPSVMVYSSRDKKIGVGVIRTTATRKRSKSQAISRCCEGSKQGFLLIAFFPDTQSYHGDVRIRISTICLDLYDGEI